MKYTVTVTVSPSGLFPDSNDPDDYTTKVMSIGPFDNISEAVTVWKTMFDMNLAAIDKYGARNAMPFGLVTVHLVTLQEGDPEKLMANWIRTED